MRNTIVGAVIGLSLAGLTCADAANAAIRKPTNIPAQSLRAALQTLSRDRDMQFIFRPDLVGTVQTPEVSGDLTTDEALAKLLRGTHLTFKYLDQKTVTIVPVAQPPNTQTRNIQDDDESKEKSLWDRFRVAQVDQGTPTQPSSVEGARESSNQNSSALQEVIVTAQKREERLIDVPISIVAVPADDLQKLRIATLEDLTSIVPGLALSKTGSLSYYELRGVSNQSGNASLVGLYLDEADITLGGGSAVPQINPSTYDLERVEVLRGPQGTLYGEGSAGGTVRFITKKPDLLRFAFDADVSAMFTPNGGPSQRVNAMVNVPLLQSQLGLRIAGTFDHEGGWIDQPVADQKNINGRDLMNVRLEALWRPFGRFTASAMAVINRDDRGLDYSDQNSPTTYTQVYYLTTAPRIKSNHELYNLTLMYEFDLSRLLSSTSYLNSAIPIRNQSATYQETDPAGPPPDSAPDWYHTPFQETDDRLFTQDLRLSSIGPGPWQWTVGVFYKHYRDSSVLPNNYFGPSGPAGTGLPEPYFLSSATLFKSWSAFADTSYRLWDRLTVGAGARFFTDHQDYSQVLGAATSPSASQTARFHSADPRVYAQYKPADAVSIYASAAKGFRSGGFNFTSDQPNFGPESVWTYELGAKASLLGGSLSADSAVFLSNYSNYQTSGVTVGSPIPLVGNVGRARIKGVEWDLTWKPGRGWRLSLNGDYLVAKFVEINATQSSYNVGDPLDLVPKYQFAASGERDFTWSGRHGFVRLDYSQTGRKSYTMRNIGAWWNYESDVIRTLNLHSGLFVTDNLRIGVFAENLLNDQGFVSPFSQIGTGVRSRPRTYGLEFGVTLDGLEGN